ncbi:hypothetical protein P3S68_018042 [Capsicum galapagoense]
MLTHLLTCSKMPRNQIADKDQTQLGFQSVEGGVAALCRMVIVDELPFRFVEKEGFRNFMKVAQPHFKIPSRTTVTRDCFKLFDEEKQKLKSHRGEDMANEISKCLRDWGIDKNFTITGDNASSNDVTMKELAKIFTKRGTNFMNGEHIHVRCMAHIINLIVQDGLKVTDVSIERVRKAVKYIRQSPARCKRFQECCLDLDINSKKSLCLAVSMRWNSTYLMLNRTIECEHGFLSYVDRDIDLSHYLQFVEDEKGTVAGALSSDDWDHVKKIINFLQIFYDLTKEVSRSLYIISNLHFLKIYEVSCYLKQLISSDDDGDDLLGKIASNMKEKFDKYREEGLILESGVKDYMNLMYGILMKQMKVKPRTSTSCLGGKYIHPDFLILAEMARDVLAIPISSVTSESAFSTGGRILDSFRSSLTPKLVQTLVCLQYWIQSESQPVSIEGDIDVLEKLEQGVCVLERFRYFQKLEVFEDFWRDLDVFKSLKRLKSFGKI